MHQARKKWKVATALAIFSAFATFGANPASAIDVKMTPEEYQKYLQLKKDEERKSLHPCDQWTPPNQDCLGIRQPGNLHDDGRSELERSMRDIVPPEERVFSPGERECQTMLPRNSSKITITNPMTATVNFNSKSRYEGSLMLTGPSAECMPIYIAGSRQHSPMPEPVGWILVRYDGGSTVSFPPSQLMITADPRQPVNRDIGKFEAFGRRFDGVEVAVAISAPTQGVDVFRHGGKK